MRSRTCWGNASIASAARRYDRIRNTSWPSISSRSAVSYSRLAIALFSMRSRSDCSGNRSCLHIPLRSVTGGPLAKKSSVITEPLVGSRYVGCLGPFLPLRDLEFDGIAFCEALVPVGCDRTVVNKYIGPTIVTDKTKTLGIVKPFHSPFKAIHSRIPLRKDAGHCP